MKIVSEDNRNSWLNSLLSKVYKEVDIVYSKGNTFLMDVVQDLVLSTKEEIIVYIDLVPGTNGTSNIFIRLLKEFKDFKNVYVVPILSSEACLIKSLEYMGYSLDELHKNILSGNISYKDTLYQNERTLEKAIKEFYKSIDILKNKRKYYKKESISIEGKSFSLEDRAVYFVLAHIGYLSNDITERYTKDENIDLFSCITNYISLYNKIAKVSGFILFDPQKIKEYCDGK